MKQLIVISIILAAVGILSFTMMQNAANTAEKIPSYPLKKPSDLDILIDRIGGSRVVLLGEASHGTAEYYTWRTEISKRLITEKGFTVIGVEGEWADSYKVNQFVKGPKKDSLDAVAILKNYDRWPTWMWGNRQVASLVKWLNNHNQSQPENKKAGFYGLDVYCLWESMEELMPYIKDDDQLSAAAKEVKKCFQPFSADPGDYAYAVATAEKTCRTQTENLHQAVMKKTNGATANNESQFVMQQNTLVALNGENYYRTSVRDYAGSWNIRDRHMMQTIKRLLELHGPDSKIIVWEHNTHVGDARYTDMAGGGMVNVGQLAREEYGRENVFAVGFGSYKGTVTAAKSWGGTIENMPVPAAMRGSWEERLHRDGAENKIILSAELKKIDEFRKPIGHRAIGVQYDPKNERGNYVPSIIPERYDAFIFIDQTKALKVLPVKVKNEPPDTYPFGT